MTVILVGYPLIQVLSWGRGISMTGVLIHEVLIAATILLAAIAAVLSSSRLAAVAALGVVGFGMALLFIFFGAPDLAMTQFAIESLTVVLFVLVIYKLPQFGKLSSARVRLGDLLIAVGAGVLMEPPDARGAAATARSRSCPVLRREQPGSRTRTQCGQRHPRGFPCP